MNRYRLVVTGKLYHLIKLLSDRTDCLKDSKKEPLADTYELKEVELETMRIFGHKSGDNEEAKKGTIQLKFKMVLKNNIVNLTNMSISEWQDPGNDQINPSWREMKIQLATVKDSSTKLPERFCGETRLELNTSYLQLCPPDKDGVIRWYKHITKLPAWASESEYLNTARWIEEKVFGSITTNVVQKSKEVRLEEKKEKGEITKRPIVPEENEEGPYIFYGKLEEHTQEIVVKKFSLNVEQGKGGTQTSERSLESRKVEVGVENDERYDHLNAKNNSVEVNESEENEVNMKDFLQGKERAEDFPRYHREERNEDIQQISKMSEQMHISNPQRSQVHISNPQHSQGHISNPQHSQRMADNFSMSEQVHISSPQHSQVHISNPQHNQRNAENFSMSQQDRDTRFVQYNRNMQNKEKETPPYNRALKPAGFMNQGNPRNENEKERPRQMGNYVRLAHNSSAGTKVRGNVENNRDWEEQRAHTEYVRLYNHQLRNLPMTRGIRCEIPRVAGPPNQTTIDDLIMFTPRPQMFTPRNPIFRPRGPMFTPRGPMFTPRGQMFTPTAPMFTPRDTLFTPRAPREPLIKQPYVPFQTDLLGTQTPFGLGVEDPQLLPKNPTNQLLEKDIRLGEEQRRLEEQQPSNNEKEKEPDEPHYEEIPDRIDDNVEQPTPKSWAPNTFPFKQQTPPSVVVNCSPDTLPKAFVSNTMARPPFTFQEQAPTQNPLQETTTWREGDELGAVGGLGRSERVQIEELNNEDWEKQVQNEELNEDTWENEQNEDDLEWDNMEFNWQEQLWQPRVQSAEEEQQELKKLIDKEVLIVHNLERRINRSEALENIYNHKNIKCSLLYEDHIVTVTTNPNHLHDNPKERIRMMRDIYEEVQLEKEKRIRALENMAEMDTVRKSKRLSMKPRKRYK